MSARLPPIDCHRARGLFIDARLRQAAAGDVAAMEAHLAGCEECRDEVVALDRTLLRLRQPSVLTPSANFTARLERALDGADETPGVRRLLDETRFRLLLLGHQLRWSRRWQLRVAAALLPLLFGIALVVRDGVQGPRAEPVASAPGTAGGPAAAPETVAVAPSIPELVAWAPQFDPPVEAPVRPAPVLEELRPQEQEQATAALERLNEVDEAALARLRAIERADPRRPPEALEDSRPPLRRALDWLARNQRPDGSFTPGDGPPGFDCGVTGLALLALVSDGRLGAELRSLDESGPPVDPLRRGDARRDEELEQAAALAANWLYAQQSSDGRFGSHRDPAIERTGHALATLALVERHLRLRARQPDAAAANPAVHDRLEQALSWLEVALDQTFHAPRERNAGAVAAWASLALATARHGGLDFHLKVSTDALCERMAEQLRADPSEVLSAASQTVLAMAARDPRAEPLRDPKWARAVSSVVTGAKSAEPALRFLVASALVADSRELGREAWPAFQRSLAAELLPQQAASGFFEAGIAWTGLGGGTVYETALGALVLQVESRRRAQLALKAALAPRGGR